jgi:EmrB/QacA subfamily drug resistance transporter
MRMGTPAARWVLFTTVLGSGLAMLDATVVNVALARIGRELKTDFSGLQWTINAYTLTLAGLILLGGSLGDRFGRRRVFVVGVVWFATASLVCGLAQNIGMLVAARALQGVGGALLTPGGMAIISASFQGADRAAAVGMWSGLGGVAGAVGPLLGGWLVEWSWRAVFLVNLPVAALIVAVAARHVPESRDPDAAPHLDVAGTVLALAGLGGLTYALTAAGAVGPSAGVIGLGAGGVLALMVFVLVERGSRQPLMPTGLFGNAQFSAINAVTLLVYAPLAVLLALLVLQLQVVSGFSPLRAGTALLPMTTIMLLFSARAGALAQRIGPRIPLTAGVLISAAGLLLMLRIGPGASYWIDVLPPVAVFGAGAALTVAPLTAAVLNSAPDHYAGIVSGINNAVARTAGLLAVAVIPAAAGISGHGYADPLTFGPGFRASMLISSGLLAVGALLASALIRCPLPTPEPAPPSTRVRLEECLHCGVTGPQVHPREPAGTSRP